MKRSTLSILVSAAILAVGGTLLWFLLVAPRLQAPAPVVTPPPPPPPKAEQRYGGLNLYLSAPETLPAGVVRAELTLVKATLVDAQGTESKAFEGVQRVVLQSGVAEKVLSEQVMNGRWTGLKLEFSPAAEFSMADGSIAAALVGHREAMLSFDADLPVSRTLALFARVPLAPQVQDVEGAKTADLSADPVKAEPYVFGSSMVDARGKGNLWSLPRLSLPDVVRADLGLDISTVMPGSQGFTPADRAPAAPAPSP